MGTTVRVAAIAASLLATLGACAHPPPPRAQTKSAAVPGAPSSQAPPWGEAPHDQRTEDNQKLDAASHGH